MSPVTPPDAVMHSFRERSSDEDPLLFAAVSDLTFDGRLERTWLLVARHELCVFTEGPAPCLVQAVPLEKVEHFRTAPAVGSGLLQAWVDGAWVDLLRFANGQSHAFGAVCHALEELRADGQVSELPEKAVDERRCQACDLALSFPGETCPRCIDRSHVLGRVWGLLRPYRAAALVLCLLVLLGVVLELAPPKLQQYLVDHVLQAGAEDRLAENLPIILLGIVATLAATRVILSVVNMLKGMLANQVGTAMTSDLRGALVEKLQQLSVDYYDRQPVGVLMTRVAHDTEALYGFIHQLTGGFLLQILQVIGVGVMLFTLNARLAMWTLVPMPLVLYGSWFFWRHVYPRYYRYWDAASKQAGALAGMLSGIRVVKAFAQEDREFARFQATSDRLRQSRLGVEVSAAAFSSAMQLVFSLGGLIVWYVGGRDVLGNDMTLGALIAFLAYLAMFYTPLTTLAQLTTWLTSFLTAGQRVFELLDTPARLREPEIPTALPTARGRVRFERVTFGYDRHHPVLRDFDLDIRAGEMIGVVGRSGSGKTTLVNLIARFYDVDAGRVTLDGHDVRTLAGEDLRRHVGVVLQEPFLFRGTIWDNLVYGRPGAEIEQALTAAHGGNAHDFVMRLPLAYDTPLGERGAGLSGGERQRLSIARTLLYDPAVLILDEATSSVDTESEKAIQDALAALAHGRTTIAIAHRLSTLRNADRILVMDRGRLIEQGSHEELLAQNGTYSRLVRIQTYLGGAGSVDGLSAAVDASGGGPTATVVRRKPKRKRAARAAAAEKSISLCWLDPGNASLRRDGEGRLRVTILGKSHGGVFAVRALPASWPNRYVSLRHADTDGHEHEVGLVRDLADWPAAERQLLEESLARRYFIRRITGIETIELRYGLLSLQVATDQGPAAFLMRNSNSAAQDFGSTGKLLIDVDDNRYLVADVEALPRRQQTLFRRFVYW